MKFVPSVCVLISFFCWQLLGDMLLDRSNSSVMMRYVSSKDNLKVLMDLLKVGILLSNFSFFILLLLLFTEHNLEHKYMYNCLLYFVLSQESSKNIQVEAFHVFKVNNKKYLHTDFERMFFECFLFFCLVFLARYLWQMLTSHQIS